MPGNEVDLYSPGGLQPLAPSPTDLQRSDWGVEPDYSRDIQQGGAVTFFGEPVQCTPQRLEQVVSELSGAYQYAMAGQFPLRHIQAAQAWLLASFDQPPRGARTTFNLPREYAQDPVAQSFAAHMQAAGASVTMVMRSILWLEEVTAQLNSQQVTPVPRTATPTSDPTDSLSDADYAKVIAANERAQAATMDFLRDHWGRHFQINLQLVQEHYAKLPPAHQKHLDQYTTGWIKGTNRHETILALFSEAMGSVPSNPAAVNAEIAELEKIMREERRRWNSDESLGARYRQLLDLRGGR